MIDFMGKENNLIVDLSIKGSHHRNMSVILLLQNAFARNMRSSSINQTYLALFNNPRDKIFVSNLSKQIYPGRPKFLPDAYEKAVSKPFNYLFMDFNQLTNNLYRIRSCLYPTKECQVYTPKIND